MILLKCVNLFIFYYITCAYMDDRYTILYRLDLQNDKNEIRKKKKKFFFLIL